MSNSQLEIENLQPSKYRMYWDIQRDVLGCIDFEKYGIDEDEIRNIGELIYYGIKLAYNMGDRRGFNSARRRQIKGAFEDVDWIKENPSLLQSHEEYKTNNKGINKFRDIYTKLPSNIDGIPPNAIREAFGCEPILRK